MTAIDPPPLLLMEARMFMSFLLRSRPLPQPMPAPAALPVLRNDDDDDGPPPCGWFESSWALNTGLAVSDLPDSDGTVAALWFAELAPHGRCSAQQA